MRRKKLLFVAASLAGGGAERVVVNLINHLDKDKYDISLVLFEDKQDYRKELHVPLKVICLNKKNRWDFLKLIFRLREAIRDHRPAVVISVLYYSNIVVVLASLFLKRDFKIILGEHNYPSAYLSKVRLSRLKRTMMLFAYRKADKIISVSGQIEKNIVECFKIKPGIIKTIHNPIPIDSIEGKIEESVCDNLFSEKNAQSIIAVGRLTLQKRFDTLLRAFSLVKKKQDNIRLIILGKGILKEELEHLAKKLNISNWVNFVGFKSNPYAWIAKADIFVLSSDYEGFPMVLLEAMACGTPVISTNCPSGPDEIITNGVNGILVPLADENAMANAMVTLLRDKSLRRKFSEEGKKRAKDFDVSKILPKYEELF
jgi:glycosyltransferase involved in cell wall biosynthesis